jgi:HPt (histidine-containing phosphotransfer) domain-containing protein
MRDAWPTPSPLDTSIAVLDPTRLEQLRQLDPSGGNAFVTRVLRTYASSLTRCESEARRALEGGQWDDFARAAHTLRSSSASVGALAFAQICADIENRIRLQNLDHIDTDAARFFVEAARVRQAVHSQLGLAAS